MTFNAKNKRISTNKTMADFVIDNKCSQQLKQQNGQPDITSSHTSN